MISKNQYFDAENKPQGRRRKYRNKEKPKKRGKLIVRNLPFKNLSEEKFRKLFEEYGDIEEISLLKRDGKYVGCGFVQFTKVQNAAKAIHHANGKEMAGRRIVVDWAVPKNTYVEQIKKIKKESESEGKVKTEPSSDDEVLEFEIDKTPSNKLYGKDNTNDDVKDEDDNNDDEEEEDEDEEEEDEDEDEENEDDDDDDDDESLSDEDVKVNIKNEKPKVKSNDVEEGRTVFIKNIPFSATSADLRKYITKYGEVEYALICVDPLTEHSKGTGFVKFKVKESAVNCIKDSNKIILQDSPLEVTLALSKERLEEKKKQKHVPKDSRNLYLIREGVVIAGSKAAEGVSAPDMAKRLEIEQWKNQILKNLNMFVSKTRLVIHNLPPQYTDEDLKKLFSKHSNPNAVVREARVMRDRKNVNLQGVGASKEVGFVSFTEHEDALTALRNINNNPTIFTAKKRPIVGFSIENRAILNMKQKRMERSRAKLGFETDSKNDKLSKLNSKQRRAIRRKLKIIEKRKESKKLKSGVSKTESNAEVQASVKKRPLKRNAKGEENGPARKKEKNAPEISSTEFSGVQSEPGKKVKIRSRYNLKTQAAVHKETLKKEKKNKKEKMIKEKKVERIKAPRQKKGSGNLNDDKKFSQLISQYKKQIESAPAFKKWYES